jgi:hypothetical protein
MELSAPPEHPKNFSQRPFFILTRQMMEEETRNDSVKEGVWIWKLESHPMIKPDVQAGPVRLRSRDFKDFWVGVEAKDVCLRVIALDNQSECSCAATEVDHPMTASNPSLFHKLAFKGGLA